mgnify:CR=1 FL=1|tara:strand:- start:56 stop:550 length:495 start_codon:yes stop_codon:yes gene_type:complete
MIFNYKHNPELYNILLNLSRNIFFYKKIELLDSFETRIYLMFFHFSILMIIYKQKNQKFDQKEYDGIFNNIENNLRELGFGDVSVNKKMKDLNKLLYDILLKINKKQDKSFELNEKLVSKYFETLNDKNDDKMVNFERYFNRFYQFCFELPLENMIRETLKFKL